MDKNAIKKYAIWARNELIERVSNRARFYGINADKWVDAEAESIDGRILSKTEKEQRKALIANIEKKGYRQVMEEVAYTWFNRFAALRFMEVNDYLPSRVRVFSSEEGTFRPMLLDHAIELDMEGIDMEYVYNCKENNSTEELYKYLLIAQCNALNSILPHMFEKIADYTELLLPDFLLREGSVIDKLVTTIPEEDWTDQVQIIGWLYQYYNTEPKDKVFADLKKNIKVTKENIPAATQLFTPDWIVRYMVENSLGRLWVEAVASDQCQVDSGEGEVTSDEWRVESGEGEVTSDEWRVDGTSNSSLTTNYLPPITKKWKYYLPEAEQDPEVAAKLMELRKERGKLNPEDIKLIDPCMGSGHILTYAFDVFMDIYREFGYNDRDAAQSIVANNLYGLDIDQRAFQLAYFAVMMKGRQYDRRFFNRGIIPQVFAIEESNGLEKGAVVSGQRSDQWVVGSDEFGISREFIKLTDELIDTFHDAKEYGSLLAVNSGQWVIDRSEIADDCLEADNSVLVITEELDKIKEHFAGDLFAEYDINLWCDSILDLAKQAKVMSQKYDMCVTNPPYMGLASGDTKLNAFVKKNYPDSKGDLFAVFIEKCGEMLQDNGYQAMITQHAWMFLSSFESLRKKILEKSIINMAHLGPRAFDEIGGEVVQTTSFVLGNNCVDKYKSTYARLIDANSETGKKEAFLKKENIYLAESDNFAKIPGSPVAYWVSDNIRNAFKNNDLGKFGIARAGLSTGNNDKYLKLWYEIAINNIGFVYNNNEEYELDDKLFVPCNKGGSFRRWYGNFEYVVNWSRRSEFHRARTTYMNLYYKPAITWSVITSSLFNGRYYPKGFLFDHAAASFFSENDENVNVVLGYINTIVFQNLLHMINPTINTGTDVVLSIPLLIENKNEVISALVEENITLSRTDWDTFETSWDFKSNPLVALYKLSGALVSSDQCLVASDEGLVNKDKCLVGSDQCLVNRNSKLTTNHSPLTTSDSNLTTNHSSLYTPHSSLSTLHYNLSTLYQHYKTNTNGRFHQLKKNEEELNRIFIDIYGLQDELTPEVANKDVTIASIFDTKEDIPESFKGNNYVLTREEVVKNLISYAVGCMFGRYSTHCEGLIYAGGDNWEEAYEAYTPEEIARGIPDKDAIIPISEDEYFEDDIVALFVDWMKFTFGEEYLEENLKFVAASLKPNSGNSREVIRSYFLNDFYKDHLKKYQKRPIYWLFDSGKKNGFKALIYMHRYKKDTIARIRTDYLHEQQSRYRTAIEQMEGQLANADASNKVKINKKLNAMKAQLEESRVYEEKIHHLADQFIDIDLDDGVKVNYERFKDVLAKIK